MLSFEETLAQLLSAAGAPTRTESVDTVAACGRVLAASVAADIDVPPTDNSAMDGYAVRVSDVAAVGAHLPVSLRVPAGSNPPPLPSGSAARIFTGAPIPLGADAVVMQERCQADEGGVVFQQIPRVGENIRRAGEDIARGGMVLPAGRRLRPADAGLAASIGVARLPVFARLRVAVFFTGDELVMPGEPLRPGTLYNSNRYVLRGLLDALGCEVSDLGIVPDDLAATRESVRRASEGHDLILTCGGVSVGEEDHVKAAVSAEGMLEAWKVAIKPGKPLAFGRVGDAAFIGLPGNPVSSFVTFQTLVKPYILKRQGVTDVMTRAIFMRADFEWKKSDPRREFLRVRRNAAGGLDLFPAQGSAVLSSCAWADGLVSNPPDTVIRLGDTVAYLPFEE